MNEIFKTLRDKFPFLSLIRKGDLEFVGIVQNQDQTVISFYDYGRLYSPQDKMYFLKLFTVSVFLIINSNNVFSAGSSSDSKNAKTKSLAY